MSKFNKLSRAEMKNVLGGVRDPGLPGGPVGGGDGCITSECSNDEGCATSQYGPKCQISTCQATQLPANYCWKGTNAS